MDDLKRRRVQRIAALAEYRLAELADQLVDAPPDHKEAVRAAIELERDLLAACRLCEPNA